MNLASIVIAYVAGLLAPGYLCARLLGSRVAWAGAVPLSMLLLLLGTLLLDTVGVPLRFGTVLAWQLLVCGAFAVALKWRPPPSPTPSTEVPPGAKNPGASSWPERLLIGGIALMALLSLHRGLLAPLSGFDVLFRWEFLATQILRHETLAFYPPVTSADFRIYFFPDGFAPLVSVSYWWIFSSLGRTVPEAVMPLVIAQYLSALALVYAAGAHLHSRRTGLMAAALLASTPLFFRSVMIGQETGLTALAVIGMVLTISQAVGPDDRRALVLAGLFAGVAAHAREYGLALAGAGALALLWPRPQWRSIAVLGTVTALVAGPWLMRNGVRCGNPFYNHSLGVFPVNPVFDALTRSYQALFTPQNYNATQWLLAAKQMLLEAGWPAVVGIPSALWSARRLGYLAGGAFIAIVLWALSISYTSGGLEYSMRVLSPAVVLLTVAAAIGLARLADTAVRTWLVAGAISLSLLYSAYVALAFPYAVQDLARLEVKQQWTAVHTPFRNTVSETGLEAALPAIVPPGSRILTDNPFVHSVLTRGDGQYDLVPIWSPEVRFLFDQSMSPLEQRRRLLERKIATVLVYPGNPNTAFCTARSPFYAKDSGNWKLLGKFRELFLIAGLPEL